LNESQFIHITDGEWRLLSAILSEPAPDFSMTRLPTELLQRFVCEVEEMRRTWMRPDDFAEMFREIAAKAKGEN